jgi:hypothetical protein
MNRISNRSTHTDIRGNVEAEDLLRKHTIGFRLDVASALVGEHGRMGQVIPRMGVGHRDSCGGLKLLKLIFVKNPIKNFGKTFQNPLSNSGHSIAFPYRVFISMLG